jgi:broad specificity phosphatase PhoE
VTVVLVRHGERATGGADGFSAAGKRRANLLSTMLAGAGVSAIFTSEFNRTKQMAAPLAAKLGLTAKAIASDAAAAKAQMLSAPCVVVVGHSDTVPAFIRLLGGPSGIVIKENEFDRMFVVTIAPPATQPSVLQMRYVST